jgi:hypothetical protein
VPDYRITITIVGQDQGASQAADSVGGALQRISETGLGMLAARIFERLADSLANLGRMAIEGATQFQTLQLRMEGLTARELVAAGRTDNFSTALAMAGPLTEDLLDRLKELAIWSPFEFGQVADVQTLGMAMNLTTDQAWDLTEAAANFTAGMGLEGDVMERIVQNMGQMIQQGKVTGTELRDLARGGFVPVTDVLIRMRHNLGLDTMSLDAFRKAAARGRYDVHEFINAFNQLAMEQFPDASERMAHTFYGVVSIFKDFIKLVVGAEFLGPLIQVITNAFYDLAQVLMDPDFRATVERIGRVLGHAFDTVLGAIKVDLLPALGQLWAAFGLGEIDAGDLASAIHGIADGIADAIERISDFIVRIGVQFVTAIEPFQTAWDGFKQDIQLFWEEHGPGITQAIRDMGIALGDTVEEDNVSLIERFSLAITGLGDWIVLHGQEIEDAFRNLADWIREDLRPALDDLTEWVKDDGGDLLVWILSVVGVFKAFAIGSAIFGGVAAAIGTAVAFILNPLNLLLLAIGTLIAAILILGPEAKTAWDQIVFLFQLGWANILNLASTAATQLIFIVGFKLTELAARVTNAAAQLVFIVKFKFWELVAGVTEAARQLVLIVEIKFLELLGNVTTAAGQLVQIVILKATEWYNAGRNWIQGLWDGVRAVWDRFTGWLSDALENAVGWAQDILGIHSRSQVFFDFGLQLTEGLQQGFKKGLPGVSSAIKELAMLGAGLQEIPRPAFTPAPALAGREGVTENNYYLTAQYRNQTEPQLIDDIRLLQLMNSGRR